MKREKYKLPGKKPNIFALIMMISLASVGAVLYSPSIPSLNFYFLVSKNVIQYTMTLFLLGYALGQLIYGPLANRFGRKTTLYMGVFVAIISSLSCGLAAPLHSISLLLIMRFLLAISSGVGLTVTITIINDFFYVEQSRVIFPIIAMSFAIMPGLSTFIGGLITYYLSWQYCFYFLSLYYLAAFFAISTLPETLGKKDLNALKLKSLIQDYWPLRKNWQLVGFASLVASCTLFVYVFSAQAPIIAKDILGLNAAIYGVLALIPSACILLGNYIFSRCSKKITIFQFIGLSIAMIFITSLALLIVVIVFHLTIFSFFFLTAFSFLANPMLWNSASLLATENVENKANASAVLSFINVSGAFIGVFIAGIFAYIPAKALSTLYTCVSIFMVVMALWLISKLKAG